jgi:hypothetical protein
MIFSLSVHSSGYHRNRIFSTAADLNRNPEMPR